MSRIGIMIAGGVTPGVNHFLYDLIRDGVKAGFSFVGIEVQDDGDEHSIPLDEQALQAWRQYSGPLLRCSSFSAWKLSRVSGFACEKIIVIGGKQAFLHFSQAASETGVPDFLLIPASIYNDVQGSRKSLGYDTALNVIVDNIAKVRDTASSLVYPTPRLFCIQLPGNGEGSLLAEAAVAAGCDVLLHGLDKEALRALSASLQQQYRSGKTHSLLLINQAVEPEELQAKLSSDGELDFKVVRMDEAQCMASPTAADLIYARRLKECALDWLGSEKRSGKLLIRDDQAVCEWIAR